jgi:hypothetical protein
MPLYDTATRAQVLTLKLMGCSNAEILSITGMQSRTVQLVHKKALERGFNPTESKTILNHHDEDGKSSSRPTKQTIEIIEDILSKVYHDRYGGEKTYSQTALDVTGWMPDLGRSKLSD